jgi:tetratricopeptide (TPR) repeat protein
MIAHKLGLNEEAARWFKQSADAARGRPVYPTGHDWSRVSLQLAILLREAERTIRGSTTESDGLLERWRQAAEQRVRARDASTSAYDEVLCFSGGRTPQPWLARGRRLAELGRFDEAEADFNEAVELSPQDSDVLAARAVFLADAGQPDRAAADFQAALNLLDDAGPKPRYRWGVPIDFEIAQRDEVFERLVALRKQDPRPRMTRMVLRMEQGDVAGTRADAQRLAPGGSNWRASLVGAEALWRGDLAEFERIRAAASRDGPTFVILGLAPTTEPMTTELLQAAERMWREQPHHGWQRRWLGLAQLRVGQYSEALASLEASLTPGDNWQQDGGHWPLLAIAQHHLGNQNEARRWLNKTALWLELRREAESRRVGSATGIGNILPEELLYAMAFYVEAKALIDGPDAARTERERVGSLAPDRTQATLAKVEAAWQRAVELAGDNPLPWIQRGRWYAQRGEREKADADFTKAASLTRGELNKFLQAGWWVVGPYPPNVAEFCPPQVDPDPAKPVYVIDPRAGCPPNRPSGGSVPTGTDGQLDLASLAQQNQLAAAYALAYVYSPADETRLLRLSRTHDLRVWVNGSLALDLKQADFPPQPLADNFHRMPIALRAGRNVILIKTPAPVLTARIADAPVDRVILLAEQRRFHAACETLRESAKAGNAIPPAALANRFTHAMALESEPDLYRAYCEYLVTRKDVGGCGCALLPNPTFEKHQATLISTAEVAAAAAGGNRDLGFRIFDAALIHYRAGSLQKANQFLLNFSGGKGFGVDTLRALLAHRTGDVAQAEQLLDEGLREGRARLAILEGNHRSRPFGGNLSHWWYQWACYLTLLREAEQAIRHRTAESQALIQQSEELATRQWMADPEMVAFDHPLTFQPNFVQPERKYPHYFLVRGRRLAELGRFAEAEADFNKAVEFTPDDLDALLARARFYAQRGNVERAADDFGAALKLTLPPPHENYVPGLVVGRELARHDAVFVKVAEQRPNDYRIWLGRSMRHADHGRWQEAAAENAKADWPRGFFVVRTMERACLQHLAGDLQGYRETCQGLIAEESSAEEQLVFQVRRGILVACGIAPEGNRLAPNLVERAEQLAAAEADSWVHLGTALALYRAGRFDEARLRCEKALAPSAWLDQRLALECLRAMCLHQLGRPADARALLQAVQTCIAPPDSEPSIALSKNGGPEQTIRLVRQVLFEQAAQLVNAKNP